MVIMSWFGHDMERDGSKAFDGYYEMMDTPTM